jgi:hypothetical protein
VVHSCETCNVNIKYSASCHGGRPYAPIGSESGTISCNLGFSDNFSTALGTVCGKPLLYMKSAKLDKTMDLQLFGFGLCCPFEMRRIWNQVDELVSMGENLRDGCNDRYFSGYLNFRGVRER